MLRTAQTLYVTASLISLAACSRTGREPAAVESQVARPSILLITLDTTRADAIGAATPAINALAQRGTRFNYAYATVPQTLPSHASMLTGLYPAAHRVHENARPLASDQPLLAERLHAAGYHTAAFVSAFALARRFGIARGFDVYDEDFGSGNAERIAKETTDRALTYLAGAGDPLFLWVHYYDPHFPYTPPEPFKTRYGARPYLGEVAFMDEQLGRLVQAFEKRGDVAIVVAADHGEGLGDHGEAQHGNLLYEATMRVPLIIVGPGFAAGVNDAVVSTRRIFHTILDWAGVDASSGLRRSSVEVVLGEAMKPFLDYGWQPQVMAVEGSQKAIKAGRIEVYDVVANRHETQDLAPKVSLSRAIRATLREYPLPSTKPVAVDDEGRRKLASLGYIASTATPVIRADAPRPADMAPLFPILDEAAALFVREQYARAVPLLEKILEKDPHNLDAALRLATSQSQLGHEVKALAAFKRAEAIAPGSRDVRTYLALHYGRGRDWQRAIPLLERVVGEEPDRLPALEGLAVIRERQERVAEAVALRRKIYTMRSASAAELMRLGQMEMSLGKTAAAIESFEKARTLDPRRFRHDLELGVLYLAARQFDNSRHSLDRVRPNDPRYPMALFKRAQVSVLLHEDDRAQRIAMARQHADATTRELIERERLFR